MERNTEKQHKSDSSGILGGLERIVDETRRKIECLASRAAGF